MSRAIPSYRKRSDGYAFVEHKSIPTKSHRMVLGKYGSPESRQRYQAFLSQIEGNPETAIVGRWPTVDEAVDRFVSYAEKRYMRSYGRSSEYVCMAHAVGMLDAYGELPMSAIRPATLVAIRSQLAKRLARSSVNHVIARLKRFFRWCCENGLAPPLLHHELSCVRGLVEGEDNCREPDPILPAKRESIFGVLPFLSPQVATMTQCQYRSAMRPGEVCRLRADEIDTTGDVWLCYPSRHKVRHKKIALVYAIPKSAQMLLQPYLSNAPYMFPAPRSAHYRTELYRDDLNRGFEKAKEAGVELEPFRPNQLRHAIATHAAKALGKEAAQLLCGHKTVRTTEIYARQEVDQLIKVARQLERTLNASA